MRKEVALRRKTQRVFPLPLQENKCWFSAGQETNTSAASKKVRCNG